MKKAVIFSSQTGNTEAMAEAIAEGAKEAGSEVYYSDCYGADIEQVLACDIIFLGSPAMGDEVLDDPMEVFFKGLEKRISGKKLGIFGSYDWGDGQWLRDWADRIAECGGECINGTGLKANLAPTEEDIKNCKSLGKIH